MPNQPVDVSHFAPELLNRALDLSLEWGENWMKPINERIRAAYPELTEADSQTLNSWCAEASKFAHAKVEKWYALEVEDKAAKAMETTRQKYPQINEHNLSHCMIRACIMRGTAKLDFTRNFKFMNKNDDKRPRFDKRELIWLAGPEISAIVAIFVAIPYIISRLIALHRAKTS